MSETTCSARLNNNQCDSAIGHAGAHHDWLHDFSWTGEGSQMGETMQQRALRDPAYRDGLLAGAVIARAQKSETVPPCPPGMVAAYIEAVARGEEI